MINITEKATAEIKKLAGQRQPKPIGLRVGIRGGGCSGFSYLFEWSDTQPDTSDNIILAGDIRLMIDYKSLIYLDGSTLDYRTTLVDRGFYWINPNQTGTCGCGQSVQF